MVIRKPSVLKNLIRQAEKYVIRDVLDVPEWESFTGRHEAPGEDQINDDRTVLRTGDRWLAGYDDTRYFEADITIPDAFDGKKMYLELDFGGEGLVFIDGSVAGAVSSDPGWRARKLILFPEKASAGRRMRVRAECAVDCGRFCDHAMAGAEKEEYRIGATRLYTVCEQSEFLYLDLFSAFDAYEATDDVYVKDRLYDAVYDAAHLLDFDLGAQAYTDSVPAARALLWDRIRRIPYATPGRVIMDGHSHLDVAWLWTVNEITRKTARTFANNLALSDIYPDFHFTQSQAALFDFTKKHYPEIFERVREKVKSGQWEIVGNAWVEADTNLASGESLIRQLLYGRAFFLREFGVESDVYWLPDCFGFTWALPQIIRRSGMKYFLTSKLQNNDTSEFPLSVFRWRAHSGDEVLAYMQKVHYQGEYNAKYLLDCRGRNGQKDVTDVSFGMFGYGDGGGGCTYRQIESGRRLAEMPGLPPSREDSAAAFFRETEPAAEKLPVWDGPMYYENHRGTYTSQAFIKQFNRRGEYLLKNIELFGVMAGGYDMARAERVWKLLLINQFHDILPGTSIHEVIVNTRRRYEEMEKIGGEMLAQSLETLAAKLTVENDSVAVFSPLSEISSGVVRVRLPKEGEDYQGVLDENGNALPCVRESDGESAYLSFYAPFLRPAGATLFTLTEENDGDSDRVTAEPGLLENAFLRVELDENGLLRAVLDKTTGMQILAGKGNRMSVSHDKPVHESAWNLERDYMDHMTYLEDGAQVEVIESSAVRGVVRVTRRYHESTITQDLILERNGRTLDFETLVDWREREKVLKTEFPVQVRARTFTCEIAHGAAEYPTHENTRYDSAMFEVCCHKWFDLSEGGCGVSVLNDSKYGCDVRDNVMRLTLMRGPVCPDPTGDIGFSHFRYSLYPHAETWRQADTVRLANRENDRPTAVFVPWNATRTDTPRSFVRLSADHVVLDCVKQAEDGKGTIIRLHEAQTRRGSVTVSVDRVFTVVHECDLMERDERLVPAIGNRFTFRIRPHEVKTFRLT